ncbi:hypothetical protein TNIN_390821 [Trichonephila inaurata madagascariensis]|uniref:Secreted protein n=1 Tax=Trichonephila inaurata madagascariensis TaxID=2747483 RepID=A0A8X6M750_9ARAC|nr:hypothetical protein TNIN_390821 [Trichonephila inaurata madagascariensis]
MKKYRFYPLLLVRCSLSNFLARAGALTCTLRLRTRVEDIAWDIQTHSIPLRDTERVTDHGHQGNVGRASAAGEIRPSDPHRTPNNFAGNDTSRKVSFYPFCSSNVRFSTLYSSPFGALTCTLRLRTGSRMAAWDIEHTLNPFYGTQKGMFAFNTLARPFGALTCTLRLRTKGRGCAWDIQTHTQSLLRDTERGVSPVRERR